MRAFPMLERLQLKMDSFPESCTLLLERFTKYLTYPLN